MQVLDFEISLLLYMILMYLLMFASSVMVTGTKGFDNDCTRSQDLSKKFPLSAI